MPDHRRAALAWYGLGHIRERRGPVRDSEKPFGYALDGLDGAEDPYEKADAEIGLARVVYQRKSPTEDELKAARDRVPPARELLSPLTYTDARQLSEQGNALHWLIEQKLAGKERNPVLRRSRLLEIRGHLWESFEQRLRIARDLADGTLVHREAPLAEYGLGADRAYYNLAGINLQLAKATYEIKVGQEHADGSQAEIAEITGLLEESWKIYDELAKLRAGRYHERSHPHHAACIHGKAIIAYHRAALLRQEEQFVAAAQWVVAGLDERWKIAAESPTAGDEPIVRNDDVVKSLELLNKISVATLMSGERKAGARINRVMDATATAMAEIEDWWTSETTDSAG
jgi:hypothetical protein